MNLRVLLALAALGAGVAATAASAATNLVVNGDFSQGATGFTSDYRYVAPTSGSMMPESVYTVASDPRSVHPYWIQSTNAKPLLLVNGATASGMTVWRESLATVAGQTYDFSASAGNVCCNSAHPGDYAPSELEFQVSSDGFATFQTLGTITTHPTSDAGQFYTVTDTFQATGPVQLRIVDALTGRVGNDFAVSDVSVVAALGSGQVSAVPEPASWALMLSAMTSVGAAMRNRQAASRRAARNRVTGRSRHLAAEAPILKSPPPGEQVMAIRLRGGYH